MAIEQAPTRSDKTVTIFDVAAMAGTSTSTVSNVMKNKGYFSEKTRAAVLAAVEALHYVPNIAAQSLSLRRSNLVGIYGVNLKYLCDWPNVILLGVLNHFKGSSYSAYVVNTEFPFKLENDDDLLKQARAKFLCGVILIGWNIKATDIELFQQLDIPVVIIEQKQAGVHSIAVDHFQAGYLGGAHLVKRGCKRIALVRLGGSGASDEERVKGFKKALAERSIRFDKNLLHTVPYSASGETFESGVKVAKEIARMKPRPDGVFCVASSDSSVGLLRGFQAEGLKVPGDIALVGWDDLETIRHVVPGLTVVKQPFMEMGQLAAQLITESLSARKKAKPKFIALNPQLVLRETA